MNDHRMSKLLVVAFSISLVLSLIVTATAVADDATPPPLTEAPVLPATDQPVATDAPAATQAPVSTAAPIATNDSTVTTAPVVTLPPAATDVPVATSDPTDATSPIVTSSPAATDVPAATDASVSTASPAETQDTQPPAAATLAATAIPTPLPELLNQVPDGTQIGVTIDGQPVPLATNDAANALNVGDPIWCPGTVTNPQPGVGGCTTSYSSLSSLIDAFYSSVAPSQDGVIWIQQGADASTKDIVIDGGSSIFSTWSNYQLILQGGWDGTSSGATPGVSSFSQAISVINWNNTVGVNQIDINGTSSTGLTIDTTGDVNINDVASNNNSASGMDITATGDIRAKNISASSNGSGGYGNGAALTSSGGTITITSLNNYINTFNTNAASGLYVDSQGGASLENVTANGNGTIAAYASGAEIYSQGKVTLTGSNIFDSNSASGLYVGTAVQFIAQNITANDNGLVAGYGSGAEVYSQGNVTLTGSNIFKGNEESGLYLETGGGINAGSIVASSNGAGGKYGSGAELSASGQINLTGANIFTNNLSDGLTINKSSGVYINQTLSSGNANFGIYIHSSGSATIDCSNLMGNAWSGVEADLPGSLTLNGVALASTADANVSSGNITFNSNSCWSYSSGRGNQAFWSLYNYVNPQVNWIYNLASSEVTPLNCSLYSGTYLVLDNGNGVFVPCPLGDSARLTSLTSLNLPAQLSPSAKFVSSFNVELMEQGQLLDLSGGNGYVGFVIPGNSDGTSGGQTFNSGGLQQGGDSTTALKIFFAVPAGMDTGNLAIQYWTGSEWIELSSNVAGDLGQGYVVTDGVQASKFIEATTNFVGVFVLVQK